MKSTSVCTALLAAVGIASGFPDDLTSVDELDTVWNEFYHKVRGDIDFNFGNIGGGSRAFQYLSFHIGVAYSR